MVCKLYCNPIFLHGLCLVSFRIFMQNMHNYYYYIVYGAVLLKFKTVLRENIFVSFFLVVLTR